jgi:hypothetical protein
VLLSFLKTSDVGSVDDEKTSKGTHPVLSRGSCQHVRAGSRPIPHLPPGDEEILGWWMGVDGEVKARLRHDTRYFPCLTLFPSALSSDTDLLSRSDLSSLKYRW